MPKFIAIFLVAVMLASSFVLAQTNQALTSRTTPSDSVITASVQANIAGDKALAGTQIKVNTLNGTVMLSGIVNTQAQAEQALSTARNTEGVKDVTSTIEVYPPPTP